MSDVAVSRLAIPMQVLQPGHSEAVSASLQALEDALPYVSPQGTGAIEVGIGNTMASEFAFQAILTASPFASAPEPPPALKEPSASASRISVSRIDVSA